MSTIRIIWHGETDIPPDRQDPACVRYRIGKYLVDAVGGPPTQQEVDDILNPPPTKDQLDAEAAKQYAKLRALSQMSPAEVQAWVQANVTNLAQAQDAIATLAIAVSVLARRL